MDALDIRIVRTMGIQPYGRSPKTLEALRPSVIAKELGVSAERVRDRGGALVRARAATVEATSAPVRASLAAVAAGAAPLRTHAAAVVASRAHGVASAVGIAAGRARVVASAVGIAAASGWQANRQR